MRIGNHDLNEQEAGYATKVAEELLNFAKKKLISGLNAQFSNEDIALYLHYIWSVRKEPVAEEEPEVKEEPVEEDGDE